MKRSSLSLKIFAAAMFTLALCAVAQAQTNTYVSAATGNDANPCSRTAPCLTFAGAIIKTAARGQITALDSGNYGAVVIDKSITIDGGKGNVASVVVTAGNGISVVAGVSDTVVLRNLTINGQDTANIGIFYIIGGLLVVKNVVVERFSGIGLFAEEGSGAPSPLRAEIDDSHFEGNLIGIQQENNTKLALRNSVIIGTLHRGGPFSFGINVQPSAGSAADIKLENNEISYCQSGIRGVGFDVGGGDVELWARNNHIYGNTFGVNLSASVIYHTTSDNRLSDNGTPLIGGIQAGTTNW